MKLIVGLGNPGPRYYGTRHNVGHWVVEALGAAHGIPLRGQLSVAQFGEGLIASHPVVLAKPLTFMNTSGRALLDLCTHFSLSPTDMIVIHDDLDLVLGRVKLKKQGGDAGHYGVRSVIECLGTGEFSRIRVGIGRPATKDEIVDFVLSPFAPVELPLVENAVQKAMASIEDLLR